MSSKKRTTGTTPIYQELPTELVERLRDFARRDQRTLKVELVRAVELLLATHDTGGGVLAPAPPTVEDAAVPEKPTKRKARGKPRGK